MTYDSPWRETVELTPDRLAAEEERLREISAILRRDAIPHTLVIDGTQPKRYGIVFFDKDTEQRLMFFYRHALFWYYIAAMEYAPIYIDGWCNSPWYKDGMRAMVHGNIGHKDSTLEEEAQFVKDILEKHKINPKKIEIRGHHK